MASRAVLDDLKFLVLLVWCLCFMTFLSLEFHPDISCIDKFARTMRPWYYRPELKGVS